MPEEPFASRTIRPHDLLGRSSSIGPDGRAKRLVVPPFQRGFSWETAQIETFWEDVTGFMASNAGPGAYFVGPIVYMYDAHNDRFLLLDGQQRFATITIILAALRNLMFKLKEALQDDGDDFSHKTYEIGRDIEKDYLFLQEDPDKVYALILNNEDHSFFVRAVVEHQREERPPARLRSHRLILKARDLVDKLLYGRLEKAGYADSDGNLLVPKSREIVRDTRSMVEVLTRSLAMASIRVSGEDEAFVIFETLNDRGLKLAISDLVLNFLMRKASGDGRGLVRQDWSSMLETLGKEDAAEFLRRFWVSKYGDIKRGSLFKNIREKVEGGLDPRGLSSELAKEAEVYMSLLDPDPQQFRESAQYVRALTGPLGDRRSIPLLLSAYRHFRPDTGEFRDLARSLVALIVRYQLLGGRDPAALEKVLYGLARGVEEGAGFKEVVSSLRELSPPNKSLASDIEDPRPLKKPAAKYLVYKIAERAQGENAWSLNLDTVSLEHIFPQKAKVEDWPNKEQLAPYLWSLGNLTVIERQLNRRAGNKAFAAKAPVYEDSDIRLTREIPERWSDWTEDSVQDRMARLFEIAQDLWPEELI